MLLLEPDLAVFLRECLGIRTARDIFRNGTSAIPASRTGYLNRSVQASTRVCDASPADCRTVACHRWAYAKLGFHPGALLEGFSSKICEPDTQAGMTAQACTNCLWGLAVFQGCSLPAFEVLVGSLVSSHGWSALEDVQQHQLFQVSAVGSRLRAQGLGFYRYFEAG